MNIIKKHPFLCFYFLIWACVCTCLVVSLSGHCEELQTETRYIYGTCVQADGITTGSIDWTYGVISSYKYYSSNPLASGRANTYWILPQGYIYYPSSSLDNTGGYYYGIPFNGASLNPVVAGEPIDATSSTVYVIVTSKSGTCSAVNFSYEYVLSGDPDDPGPEDPDNPGGDVSGDDPGTDDPDNPSGPVFSEDFELYIQNSLYEIRILLTCILCVSILNIFIRRSRNGIA